MSVEPIAVVSDYADLVTALRRRVVELNTPMDAIDEVAGLPARYTSKVLCGMRGLGHVSLGPFLETLGLKLALIPDEDALARVRDRLPQRGPQGPKLDRDDCQAVLQEPSAGPTG